MIDTTCLRPATPPEIPRVGELLGAAFADPVTLWLVPDPSSRAQIMARFFAVVAEEAMQAGRIDVCCDDTGFAGALVSFDLTRPPPPADPDPRYDEIMGPWAERWTTMSGVMDAHHPTEPHQYVMLVGVRPDRQGGGVGTALMSRLQADLDRQGVPGYLEATSPGSRALYRRLGYQDHGDPFRLPDGPQMWPMWRTPARA